MTPERVIYHHQIFDGRERTVHEPSPDLKSELRLQHRHLWRLLIHNPDFAKFYYGGIIQGFVPKRSFVTHAKEHASAGSILLLDLDHAFESTTKERVIDALENLGAHPKLVESLEENAFIENFLPPGFPTSPNLFNATLLPMDKSLIDFANSNSMKYSRYADDLAFSTPKDVRFIPQEQVDYIREIIKDHGYESHKIQIGHPWSQPIEICGASLYQNEVTLPTRTLRKIRGQLHRELILNPDPNLARVWGLLGLVKMVRGKIPGSLKRYERLAKQLTREQISKPH